MGNNGIGCLPAGWVISTTGVLMLVWAFFSYLIYVFTSPNVPVCFPPLTGCVAISTAGTHGEIASIFYRATVLPAASFLGISAYFVIQYLSSLGLQSLPAFDKIRCLIGVVLTPLFLAIAEAILNGYSTTGVFEELHILFSGLAFLGIIIFELMVAYQLLKSEASRGNMLLFLLPTCALLLGLLGNSVFNSKIIEWNVFVLVSVWLVFMGRKVSSALVHGEQ
ncbi:hypothetical protein A9Q89_04265 [Gammaproteobacteria bacterium 53_120_T64]|nr:hypothetical protein A9Q89_04265 [Gammaproteobacteria bacterium 53_120_T64]